MKAGVVALVTALACLAPPAAALAGERTPASGRADVARVVEIRVTGDATALARVRMTARELLRRLDVLPLVQSADEPPLEEDDPPPLVIANVDLRDVSRPSIDIEDGRSHQELTRRTLSDVSTLETGVEAVLHVLYLAVESSLQVGAAPVAPKPSRVAPVRAEPKPRAESRRSGLDFGALFRLSSLGGSRFVPGGGVVLEPRMDVGSAQLGLQLSAAVHGTTELTFERGSADVRPIQARLAPMVDWRLSPEVAATFGLGGGFDAFTVEPVLTPDQGGVVRGETALDPMLTAAVGARVPLAGSAFLSALASLDLDLRPTAFVARMGPATETIMPLPRWRGGLTLALSFSVAGARRFSSAPEARR